MTDQVGKYKGIFSEDSENKLGEIADKAIVAKGLLEALDKPVATLLVRIPDNYFGDRLPEEYEDDANAMVDAIYDAYINGNKASWNTAVNHCVNILKGVIPLEKVIGEEGEEVAMQTIKMIAAWLIMGTQPE